MANENIQMWTELGIDLKSHDMLLSALGPMFQDIYLSQKNRPAGMGFYDFVVGDIHGIRVHELRNTPKMAARWSPLTASLCRKNWSGRPAAFRSGSAPGLSFPCPWPKKSCPATPAP